MNQNNDLRNRLHNYESDYNARIWSSISDSLDTLESNRRKSLFALPFLMISFLLVSLLSLLYIYFDNNPTITDNTEMESTAKTINESVQYTNIYYLDLRSEKQQFVSFDDNLNSGNQTQACKENHPTELVFQKKEPKVESKYSLFSEFHGNSADVISNQFINSPEFPDATKNKEVSNIFMASVIPSISIQNIESNAELAFSKHRYQFNTSNDDCLGFSNEKLRFSTDMYFSNDYGFRNLSPRADNLDSYLSMREETEIPGHSFSVGFRANMYLSSNFGVSSGLNYTQINETFKYVDPESSQIRTITTIDYIFQHGIIVDSIVNTEQIVIPGSSEFVH
jgi:hypothetical protein